MSDFSGTERADVYIGGDVRDLIIGNGGRDTLSGAGGGDIIAGNVDGDWIDGGDGSDTLFTADKTNLRLPYFDYDTYRLPSLDTGVDHDVVNGGEGSDIICAGYGDDVDGGAGGSSGDYLYISFLGAPSGVVVDFRLASQTIGGGTIRDIENVSLIQGSNFADVIDARTLEPDYGDRTLVLGMGGDDQLIADYRTGTLDGGDGDDVVDGRGSQYLQIVTGGAGSDTLYTNGNTFATARGGDGDDTIYAHALIYGDAGDDTIFIQPSYYGRGVYGGSGNDKIYGVDVDGNSIEGGSGEDWIDGGILNDYLTTDDGVIDRNADHDIVMGGDGFDMIFAGVGDDVDGGADSDTLSLSFAGSATGVVIDAGRITGGSPFRFAGGTIQNVEALAALIGSGFADDFSLVTATGRVSLNAGDGDDLIRSAASAVVVSGEGGDDRFVSGTAADVFDGGAGTDTIDYSATRGGVTVTLQTSPWQPGHGGGDELYNVENVVGTRSGDTLTGNDVANRIDGGDGADVLAGLVGDDRLAGQAGRDTIDGGDGADTLYGGGDRDTLTGGTGADTFRFEDGDVGRVLADADRITDFNQGEGDRINLSRLDAIAGNATRDAFTFVGTAAFSGQAGELRYYRAGQGTIVEGDTDGDGIGDVFLRIDGRVALTARDFGLGGPAGEALTDPALPAHGGPAHPDTHLFGVALV